jgi:hypothetical protein
MKTKPIMLLFSANFTLAVHNGRSSVRSSSYGGMVLMLVLVTKQQQRSITKIVVMYSSCITYQIRSCPTVYGCVSCMGRIKVNKPFSVVKICMIYHSIVIVCSHCT